MTPWKLRAAVFLTGYTIVVVAYMAHPASAQTAGGTDQYRLIQAAEKQAEALEKISQTLQEMKGRCK